MPKNKLNHYTTQKGRKHKKLGMGSNEHVGEGSGTQKNLNFCIKGRTPKKIKFLCLRTCTHGVFEIKISDLMYSSTFSEYNMPKNILNHYTTKKLKDENTKRWV